MGDNQRQSRGRRRQLIIVPDDGAGVKDVIVSGTKTCNRDKDRRKNIKGREVYGGWLTRSKLAKDRM